MHPQRKNRKIISWVIGLSVPLILLVCYGLLHLYFNSEGGTGSMSEAVKLRAILEPIASPEDGVGCHPEYVSKRFSNGEWLLAIGRDSHGPLSRYTGGGTFVMKDSRGRLRCFLGHVCGAGGPGLIYLSELGSLDDFDEKLAKTKQLIEQPWPEK
jgi:hypothetical protein